MAEIYCVHGCGNIAQYQTKGGKRICQPSSNSCTAVRERNRAGVAKAHQDGKVPGWDILRSNYNVDTGKGNRGKFKTPKSRLIADRGHKCEQCQNSMWNNRPITLELEHIDGNNKNNSEDNLKLLCPNCHAQTPTWRRRKSSGNGSKHDEKTMTEAIQSSKTLNECLAKLDLRWGSGGTIINFMSKKGLSFLNKNSSSES